MENDNSLVAGLLNLGRKIIPRSLFEFSQPFYHFGFNLLGALIYGFPGYRVKVIGITGTNGKSTCAYLINQILEQAGYKVASVSSVEIKIGDKTRPNNLKMTMPGRMKLQSFLHQARQANCDYVVLEVTSEGIRQWRHKFIKFDTAVLTNLTKEHIERHGSFSNYKQAKAKLFRSVDQDGQVIINTDDEQADFFLSLSKAKKIGYGLKDHGSMDVVKAEQVSISSHGLAFVVGETVFNIPLLGEFNVYNSLAAIAIGRAYSIDMAAMAKTLNQVGRVPGRLEIVVKQPFTVVVDYAHTPDALIKVYQTAKQLTSGKLIGVLGAAGGGRDKWKRPEFGRIANEYLDKIILTNEDPYDEDEQAIVNQIAQAITREHQIIIDRRTAINRALAMASPGDLVMITGKGSEPWMCVKAGKKIPFDDRVVVREEMAKIGNGQ